MPYFIADPRLRAVVRTARTLGYSACAFAGAVVIGVGSPSFGTFYVTLGVFCLVGGTLAALGALTGRWIEELLGLPLLASAMIAFSLITARDVFPIDVWLGLPSVALLAAFGVLMLSRCIDVFALSRSLARQKRAPSWRA